MKLSLREKVAYGCGDFSYALVYAFFTTFLLVYLTDIAQLPNTVAGILVLIANVFDAINDPMIGFIADRRKPSKKWGRYRGWIIAFCAPSSIFVILSFCTPNISLTGRIVYSYVTYLIWTILKTCVQVPYAGLSTSMTEDSDERSSLGAVRDWGNNIGGLVISFGAVAVIGHFGGSNATGYRISIIVLAVVACIGYLVVGFGTKEHVTMAELAMDKKGTAPERKEYTIWESLKAVAKNRYAIALILYAVMGMMVISVRMNLTAYFCTEYLNDPELRGLSVLLTMLYIFPVILIPFVPKLTRMLGKRKVMMIGSVCYMLVGVITLIAGTNVMLVYVGGAFIGIGTCFTLNVVWGAVPDACDYGLLKYGVSVPGLVCAFVTLAMGCGSGIAGTVAAVILNICGYDGTLAVQAAGVGDGIHLAFGIVPIIFGGIMLICGMSYTLSKDKVDQIHQELAQNLGVEEN